jgi:hypothetical protein
VPDADMFMLKLVVGVELMVPYSFLAPFENMIKEELMASMKNLPV